MHDFDLTPRPRGSRSARARLLRAVPGVGTLDYHFDHNAMVRQAVNDFVAGGDELVPDSGLVSLIAHSSGALVGPPARSLKPPTGGPEGLEAECAALLQSAAQLQGLTIARHYSGVTGSLFGGMPQTAEWAIGNMPARYKRVATDHARQLSNLQTALDKVLPRIVIELTTRLPGAPLAQLLALAVQLLAKQLGGLLEVLRLYNLAFSQRRDGTYRNVLPGIDVFMNQFFRLMLTGDASGDEPRIQPLTPNLGVGDLQLTAFGGRGLATIPGLRGPLKVQLLIVPEVLQDWLPLILPFLIHEAHHQVLYDWEGREKQSQDAVCSALDASDKQLGLSTKFVEVMGQKVSLLKFFKKFFSDCIGEHAADIQGGVLATGPAYLRATLQGFPGMSVQGGSILQAQSIIRTGSSFGIDGDTIVFEEHGPDTLRVKLGTAVLRATGFEKEAALLESITDWAAGGRPEFTVWEHHGAEDSRPIKVRTEDLDAVTPIVARALIEGKLECMQGHSPSELIHYNARTHAKVQEVTTRLVAGDKTVPQGIGSIYGTTIAAAAVGAHRQLLAKGEKSLTGLTASTFGMLEELGSAEAKG